MRKISREYKVRALPSGNNMNVCRSIGSSKARALPPFVNCEQVWVDTVASPPQPARGFEKLTFMLRGKIKVEFSPLNKLVLSAGEIAVSMVGRGMRPTLQSLDGTSSLLDIWVDIPEEYKRKQPRLLHLTDPTTFDIAKGVSVTLLCGKAFNKSANNEMMITPVTVMYVSVQPGGKFEYVIPDHWNAFMQTTAGHCIVNQEVKIGPMHYVEFAGRPGKDESGLKCMVQVSESQEEPALFVFGTAESLDQPIYYQGPFVDVSSDWIDQAYRDYSHRQNGFEQNQIWNDHPN